MARKQLTLTHPETQGRILVMSPDNLGKEAGGRGWGGGEIVAETGNRLGGPFILRMALAGLVSCGKCPEV